MKQTEWTGLYKASWSAAPLVPEAYSHPAKVAFGLAQKIYEHMLENGWLKPGNKVIDPFGGIAGFGFHAMRHGLHWQGVELEPRFCKLAQQNIDLWNGRYSQHFERWGTARLVQGDSRNLASILAGQVDGGLSSPPYATDLIRPRDIGKEGFKQGATRGKHSFDEYGKTNGQLGSMSEGSHDTAVSSPAYADTINSGEGPGVRHDPKTHKGDNAYKATSQAAYGGSNGQLGGMSAGDWDAAVSSSPFEESLTAGKSKNHLQPREGDVRKYQRTMTLDDTYGNHPANIGNDTGTTFWTAARQIVEQTYMVLKPGAYAAWVCGDFVRKGERIYFGRQWMELCEAVGFVPVEWATAWKREPGPVQRGMFGDVDKTIDRVSFFRKLSNNKAIEKGNQDAVILNEDVIFLRKPHLIHNQS